MPRPFTDPGRRCGCRRTGSTQRGAEPPNAACDRGGHYGCCSAGAGASAGRGGRRSVGPRSAPAVVLIDTTRMTRNPLPCKGFRGRPCRAGTARSARRTIARPDSRRPGGRAVAARRSGRSRCADCVGCARANSHAPVRCAPSRTVAPQIDRGGGRPGPEGGTNLGGRDRTGSFDEGEPSEPVKIRTHVSCQLVSGDHSAAHPGALGNPESGPVRGHRPVRAAYPMPTSARASSREATAAGVSSRPSSAASTATPRTRTEPSGRISTLRG